MLTNGELEAKNRIFDCIKNNNPFLDLSYLSLNQIPIELEHANHITELNLSNNNLFSINDVINKLDKLLFLDLSNNNLNEIRGLGFDFGNRLHLKSINLNGNLFNDIPCELFGLNIFPEVTIENNPFEKNVPLEILEYGVENIANYLEQVKMAESTVRLLEAKVIFLGRGDVGKTSLMKKIQYCPIKI